MDDLPETLKLLQTLLGLHSLQVTLLEETAESRQSAFPCIKDSLQLDKFQ